MPRRFRSCRFRGAVFRECVLTEARAAPQSRLRPLNHAYGIDLVALDGVQALWYTPVIYLKAKELLGKTVVKKVLRTVVGVVCGYVLMGGLITLVQEAWFGGVGWSKTPLGMLAIAGFFTCVAAAIGAVAATAIARPTGRVAAAIMSCLVVIETTTLIVTGEVTGPLWFDLLSAASLIVAILLGAELFLRITGATSRESAGA